MNRTIFAAAIITFIAIVSLSVAAIAGLVPDTGQTQSYTDTFGEDSDYTCNPHSYTDLGNGIVRDNVTGLEWQQATAPGTYTWAQAITYCENLTLPAGGYSDWRLPNRNELQTLVDYSRYNPATTFPNTQASYYWSSTTYVYDTSLAWYVGFYDGVHATYGKSSGLYVRAVRGGQCGSLGNLVLSGTVTNSRTSEAAEGVTVSINTDPVKTATTIANGFYSISDIPSGSYTVTASKTGFYSPQNHSKDITSTTTDNFSITPDVTITTISLDKTSVAPGDTI